MTFEYLGENFKTQPENLSSVQEILSKGKDVLIDPKYLPVIEEAEKGDINALAEIAEAFANGVPGVKPNYTLAMYFALKIYAIDQKENNPAVIFNDLENLASIAATFEDWVEARKWQLEAVKHMVNNFEPEEWNQDAIENMFTCMYHLSPELFDNR